MKCILNKPMKKGIHVFLGLIPSEKINDSWVGENDWNSIFSLCNKYDYEIIRGKHLIDSSLEDQLTEINFKFCIEKQAFYFSDKGDVNINRIQRDKIKPA